MISHLGKINFEFLRRPLEERVTLYGILVASLNAFVDAEHQRSIIIFLQTVGICCYVDKQH